MRASPPRVTLTSPDTLSKWARDQRAESRHGVAAHGRELHVAVGAADHEIAADGFELRAVAVARGQADVAADGVDLEVAAAIAVDVAAHGLQVLVAA